MKADFLKREKKNVQSAEILPILEWALTNTTPALFHKIENRVKSRTRDLRPKIKLKGTWWTRTEQIRILCDFDANMKNGPFFLSIFAPVLLEYADKDLDLKEALERLGMMERLTGPGLMNPIERSDERVAYLREYLVGLKDRTMTREAFAARCMMALGFGYFHPISAFFYKNIDGRDAAKPLEELTVTHDEECMMSFSEWMVKVVKEDTKEVAPKSDGDAPSEPPAEEPSGEAAPSEPDASDVPTVADETASTADPLPEDAPEVIAGTDPEPAAVDTPAATDAGTVCAPASLEEAFKALTCGAHERRTIFDGTPAPAHPPVPFGCDRYLGYVASNNGNFYNFYPVARWDHDRFCDLLPGEAKERFPTWGAFNLGFDNCRLPKEGAFYVVDLDRNMLTTNLSENGRSRTDYQYRVRLEELEKMGRIAPADKFGVYPVVRPAEDASKPLDLTGVLYVRITSSLEDDARINLSGESVLLEVGNMLYGPVRLKETAAKRNFVKFGAVRDGLVPGFSREKKYYHLVQQFAKGGDAQHAYISVTCADTNLMTPVKADIWSDLTLLEMVAKGHNVPNRDEMVSLLKDGDRFFGDDPVVAQARLVRLKYAVLRGHSQADARQVFADFLYQDIQRKANGESLAALTRRVASDDELVALFVNNTTIGKALESKKEDVRLATEKVNQCQQRFKTKESELRELENKAKELVGECEKKRQALGLLDKHADIFTQLSELNAQVAQKQQEYARIEALENEVIDRLQERESAEPGNRFLPDGAGEAIAVWTETQTKRRLASRAEAMAGLEYRGPTGRALASALVDNVKGVRPGYDDNTILNLYLSMVQNFLTVLAGAPGSGKTSICGILADSLALNDFSRALGAEDEHRLSSDRFINVPVEYGWTTKRDFIGYWNPLTGRFESPDPDRWMMIRRLDAEATSEAGSCYPALMLLDEANLSPMEYYWSDWMRLCDSRTPVGEVRLWDKAVTKVPETLRFMATINSDGTTEPLSPRLIDRAAVITLPNADDMLSIGKTPKVPGIPVPWSELKAVFGARAVKHFKKEVEQVLTDVYRAFDGVGIRFSPRSRQQMFGYIGAASEIFRAKGTKLAYLDAVDFAVMQKCLPRINGTGDDYREGLEAICHVLDRYGLDRSRDCLGELIANGRQAMDCYRFF